MVNESLKHKELKCFGKLWLEKRKFSVFVECKLNNHKLDLIGIQGNEMILCECIVSQSLTNAMNKLSLFEQPSVIFRYRQKRNNLANSIINKIKSKGIQFIEFDYIRYNGS